MTRPKKPSGGQTKYTPEIGDRICELIATGKSLVFACADVGVSYSTAMKWIAEDAALSEKYTQAREHQADWHADDIMTVADDASLSPDDRRVRIDARKWVAAKLRPKKYGDRVNTHVSDGDGNPLAPATFTINLGDAPG